MELPNFNELFQDNSLSEIYKYFQDVQNAFLDFKNTLFSVTVSEYYIRHLITQCHREISEVIPSEITYDWYRTNYGEKYTFYCRDEEMLNSFIKQLKKDADYAQNLNDLIY